MILSDSWTVAYTVSPYPFTSTAARPQHSVMVTAVAPFWPNSPWLALWRPLVANCLRHGNHIVWIITASSYGDWIFARCCCGYLRCNCIKTRCCGFLHRWCAVCCYCGFCYLFSGRFLFIYKSLDRLFYPVVDAVHHIVTCEKLLTWTALTNLL